MNTVEICENVYIQRHPLSMMGLSLGRVVTVIRLQNGRTWIHSTANFGEQDRKEILELGEPEILMEATNFHDTFARDGRKSFPHVTYLVPKGFPNSEELDATTINPRDNYDEIHLIPIRGLPKLGEVALFHKPSKTLVLADLIFNLPDTTGKWTKWVLKTFAKIKSYPGQSAYFRHFIEDQQSYEDSVHEINELPFERIIVGHGDPIEKNAKQMFKAALSL